MKASEFSYLCACFAAAGVDLEQLEFESQHDIIHFNQFNKELFSEDEVEEHISKLVPGFHWSSEGGCWSAFT